MGRRLHSLASALTGAVTAAGVMYYFDADSGRRRRAALEQRSASVARRGLSRLQSASRDLAHRLGGLGARATALIRGGEVAPPVLAERVRSRLGRVLSHPGAVHVEVDPQRTVRLSGAVLAWEHEPLCRAVTGVPGVQSIRDELQVHESAEHVSALQGAGRRAGRQAVRTAGTAGATDASGGSAALRLLMALAGGSLLLGGSRRRGALGAVGAAAGGALLLRSVATPRRRVARPRGRALEVCRTLHVRAGVDQVYAALRQGDRLVALLPALRALRHRADGATQWTVSDPEGWRLEWTAVITELQSNRQIAWRSTEDSALMQWGMVWLEPIDAQHTRAHLYVSFRMAPGRTGQALRRLLGSGPRGELTQHLGLLRQYLEGGGAVGPPAAGAERGAGATGTAAAGTGAAGTGAAGSTSSTGSDQLAAWTQPMTGRTH